jgi:hypothetical protein
MKLQGAKLFLDHQPNLASDLGGRTRRAAWITCDMAIYHSRFDIAVRAAGGEALLAIPTG